MKIKFPLLVVAMSLLSAAAGDKDKSVDGPTIPFEVWLGQQTNLDFLEQGGHPRATVDSSDSDGEDSRWAKIEDKMNIDLQIIAGSKVKLPDTENGYTTLINGEVASVFRMDELQIRPNDLFKRGADELQIRPNDSSKRGAEVAIVVKQVELPIRPNNMYVMGVVYHKEISGKYYSLNARITKGPLKGAVVHLRDDKRANSIKDPFVAIYKIPSHIQVAEGNLEYKIIRIHKK